MAMPPEPIGVSRKSLARREPQLETLYVGEVLIDWISFWSQFGIIGAFIANRLADKLDECSQWLEDYLATKDRPVGPCAITEHQRIRDRWREKLKPLPALPPTGGSGIKVTGAGRVEVIAAAPRIGDDGVISCGGRVINGGYVGVPGKWVLRPLRPLLPGRLSGTKSPLPTELNASKERDAELTARSIRTCAGVRTAARVSWPRSVLNRRNWRAFMGDRKPR